MVVNRHGKCFFGFILPNYILIQSFFDLGGLWKGFRGKGQFAFFDFLFFIGTHIPMLGYKLTAGFNATVADIGSFRGRNEKFHGKLVSSAKGAVAKSLFVVLIVLIGHEGTLSIRIRLIRICTGEGDVANSVTSPVFKTFRTKENISLPAWKPLCQSGRRHRPPRQS